MNRLVRRAAAVVAGLALAAAAAAQSAYPSKPITMIVPYPAGGPSDFVARQIQGDFAKALGGAQPVIIDNVGGVSGALGVQKMLQAPADGHTLTLGSPLEFIITPLTVASAKYGPSDWRMVAQIVKAPMVLLARRDLPASSVDELVALAKKDPGRPLSISNTGQGSAFHLIAEKFAQDAGIKLLHIPYKGGTPAMADMMGGQVDLGFAIFAGPVAQMIADGKVKALGVTTKAPLAAWPKIAAIAALPGFGDMEFDSWAGVQASRKVPDDVAERLNHAAYEALKNPVVRRSFEATGNQVVAPMTLAELDRATRAETARYQAIARSINLQTPP